MSKIIMLQTRLHLSTSVSFFIAIIISMMAIITLMYQWNLDPQSILVGGGVVAIIVGIGISNIAGNMLSAEYADDFSCEDR